VRAFTVWALSGLGYIWPAGQLDDLAKDASWKVRVNAAVARQAAKKADGAGMKRAIVQAVLAAQ
jgi:hypothetical protein